jgi:hypothetical protein
MFVLAYALLQPFGVPGTIFVVAAPLIWPWPAAFAVSMAGTMAASVVGFSFARFVARDWVSARIPARLRRYDEAIARHAFTTVVVLRLVLWVRAHAARRQLPGRRDVRCFGSDPARRLARVGGSLHHIARRGRVGPAQRAVAGTHTSLGGRRPMTTPSPSCEGCVAGRVRARDAGRFSAAFAGVDRATRASMRA